MFTAIITLSFKRARTRARRTEGNAAAAAAAASWPKLSRVVETKINKVGLSPQWRRDDMPPSPPMAVQSKNRGGSTPVRGRVRSRAHSWWLAVAELQAANVPIA